MIRLEYFRLGCQGVISCGLEGEGDGVLVEFTRVKGGHFLPGVIWIRGRCAEVVAELDICSAEAGHYCSPVKTP